MTTVGSVVYATKSGLGTLAKLLYDSGIIDKVLIAENGKFESHAEWYDRKDIMRSQGELLDSCDTLFLLEAPLPDPFDWSIAKRARSRGKKVVLMPMYESTPRGNLSLMDKVICPSKLDLEYFHENACFLPVPAPNNVTWRKRTYANVFVHNVGHGGIFSRNGTAEIIKALPLIKSGVEIRIRIQPDANKDLIDLVSNISDSRVIVEKKNIPFDQLWETGDVFLFPEKFNGLSLPLQEAYSAGMLVMAGDRFPVNDWLPRNPLIPVSDYFTTELPWIGIKVKNALIKPEEIARTVDYWAGKDIEDYSVSGRMWAENNSGSKLKPLYDKILR